MTHSQNRAGLRGPRPVRLATTAVALGLGLMLAGCGSMADNRSLDNVHQPVVEHTNFTFDLTTLPEGGFDAVQARRLGEWFGALGLKYGDHLSVDDPADTLATRAAVEVVAAKYGLMVDSVAPVTEGRLPAGMARVVISRTFASVPGCPDWTAKSDANYRNATSRNYGCATSSNMAAMIANKEDLIHGQDGTGSTVVATNAKAIDAYRAKAPTGAASLKQQSTN